MQAQLAALVTRLEQAQERVHRLADRTPEGRWNRRSDPARWSVAECVVHLSLTTEAYLPLLRRAFDDPRVAGAKAPAVYRRDAVGWMLEWFTGDHLRVGKRRLAAAKTIAAFVPNASAGKAAIVADFDRLQAALIALTRDAEGRPLERMRITSPFNAGVSYNTYSCLVILPGHQERHLWQAEQVWP